MTTRINNYRTSAGADALTTNATLTTVAQAQADYNAAHNINSDSDGSGATVAEQLQTAGYDFATVAYLFNNQGESASFNEWKNNPAYSNIMRDGGFSEIGVGTAQPSGGLRRWVVVFANTEVPTSDTVQQMLDLLNDYRTAHGKAEFTLDDNLTIAAQAQAAHNASVQANDKIGVESKVNDTGYSYGLLMWTVANGGAESALGNWTDSPDEQTQMQDDRLQQVGIAVASGGTKQWWVVIYAEPGTP